MVRLFDKILIANRGEIACRVMRTANRLGIRTVAIYSDADSRAAHVAMADEAVCVGAAASAQSYLRIDAILDAVRRTGAQAVHPGYGFLSENAEFSEAVEAAGAAFVGPNAFAIRAMGDKIESKKLAEGAGVDTIPGFNGILSGEDEAAKVAAEVGYPVMIKASAGGGGKGMRIAWNEAEARQGFALSQREAASSFGDDRIFIERFVQEPRHIEIQLLADTHGNCIYLPERECSIQRRNQKVVEEAPAANLKPETVRAMGKQAVALAKAVGYRSAGTVEYLVDANQQHYFLEMNTRLQVEHPVTEQVTGIDLVEQMIRVAAGETLGYSQADVATPKGWAFESRVYAEDPLRNFLPSIGTLSRYQPPKLEQLLRADEASGAEGAAGAIAEVRVDDGVVEGGEVSIHYDPMIAKLVTHGSDREHARRLMIGALDRYVIDGATLRHNVNFLRSIMTNKAFANAALTTNFIPQEFPDGYSGYELSDSEKADLLACAASLQHVAALHDAAVGGAAHAGAAAAAPRALAVRLDTDGADADVAVEVGPAADADAAAGSDAPLLRVAAPRWARTVRLVETGLGPEGLLEAVVSDNNPYGAPRSVALQVMERQRLGWRLVAYGSAFSVLARPPAFAALHAHMKPPPKDPFADALTSPMPGTLVSVNVAPGDEVAMGHELAVVEAMKMQNVLTAERDGVVKAVLAAAGATLSADEPILTFEE